MSANGNGAPLLATTGSVAVVASMASGGADIREGDRVIRSAIAASMASVDRDGAKGEMASTTKLLALHGVLMGLVQAGVLEDYTAARSANGLLVAFWWRPGHMPTAVSGWRSDG